MAGAHLHLLASSSLEHGTSRSQHFSKQKAKKSALPIESALRSNDVEASAI
jgi:hypothetical protein